MLSGICANTASNPGSMHFLQKKDVAERGEQHLRELVPYATAMGKGMHEWSTGAVGEPRRLEDNRVAPGAGSQVTTQMPRTLPLCAPEFLSQIGDGTTTCACVCVERMA